MRKGCVSVFGVPDKASGTEKVVVLAETRETDPAKQEALGKSVAATMTALHGAPPDDIVLAPPHAVPKTSSGKLRRAACQELYERGMPGTAPRAVQVQIVRLVLSGFATRVRDALARLAAFAFGAYVWTLLALITIIAVVLAIALPRRAWRRRAATLLARAFVAGSRLVGKLLLSHPDRFSRCGSLSLSASTASSSIPTARCPISRTLAFVTSISL